jgi:hypothetical protein
VTTFAARLAELMDQHGYGVLSLSRDVPIDQAHVSRMMHGKKLPSGSTAQRLDELLGAGGELVALSDQAHRAEFGPQRPSGRDPGALADEAEVRQTSQDLIRMERRLGGNAMLPAAARAFAVAAKSAGDDHDQLAAAAEAGEVAGWISYDADRADLSRRYAADALTLSREAGDGDMEGFLASHLTMLDIEQGRPASALRISAAMLERRRLPKHVEAVFRIRQGRALVRLGRTGEGLTDLERAGQLIADGPGSRDPWWTFWVTPSEIWWQQGTARGDVGDWRGAVPLLGAAANARSAGHGARTVLHDQACLAESLVRVGALDDARQVIGELSPAARTITSARTSRVLLRTAAHATAAGDDALADEIRALAA